MKTTSTDLVCLKCGNIATIYRNSKHLRNIGHIKDLYCYKCKCNTKHYEVKDIDEFMNTQTGNKVKNMVKELINKKSVNEEVFKEYVLKYIK